jgi:hypothetical protein
MLGIHPKVAALLYSTTRLSTFATVLAWINSSDMQARDCETRAVASKLALLALVTYQGSTTHKASHKHTRATTRERTPAHMKFPLPSGVSRRARAKADLGKHGDLYSRRVRACTCHGRCWNIDCWLKYQNNATNLVHTASLHSTNRACLNTLGQLPGVKRYPDVVACEVSTQLTRQRKEQQVFVPRSNGVLLHKIHRTT